MRYVHVLGAALLALSPAFGQDGKPDTEAVKEDIAAHRTMAHAHENAAKCLEAGKPEKECHEQLQKDCQGEVSGNTAGCGTATRTGHPGLAYTRFPGQEPGRIDDPLARSTP